MQFLNVFLNIVLLSACISIIGYIYEKELLKFVSVVTFMLFTILVLFCDKTVIFENVSILVIELGYYLMVSIGYSFLAIFTRYMEKKMDINNISEAFTLPLRLSLISCLVNGEKTFNELKNITKASDGNISVQLSKLEKMEFITPTKTFVNTRYITVYEITEIGLSSLQEYVSLLEEILKESKYKSSNKREG